MNLILGIAILSILVIYFGFGNEIKYNFDLITFNPKSMNVDINNNNFKKKLKILILSTDNRNTDYIQFHKQSWTQYSETHDYTFLFEEPCDNLPIYYCKYQRILQLMTEYPNYDYFLWVDSDTIINKKYTSFPLESMIEQIGTDIDFIYTEWNVFNGTLSEDFSRNTFKAFIGGFYMFKNNSNTKKLLQNCINYIDQSKWTSLKKGNCAYGGECYEEAAMFYNVRNNKDIKHTRILGNFLYNGNKCYDGYFIVHDLKKNVECFRKRG